MFSRSSFLACVLAGLPLCAWAGPQIGLPANQPVPEPRGEAEAPESKATAKEIEAIKALIEQLQGGDVEARERAQQALIKLGSKVAPFLKDAANAKDPELAARAKRILKAVVAGDLLPAESYAEIVPETSVFFVETGDAKAALKAWRESPAGKAWYGPAIQKWWKYHLKEDYDEEEQDAKANMSKAIQALDGHAAVIMGDPATIDEDQLALPMVYVGESRSKRQILTESMSKLLNYLDDVSEASRSFGPFEIDERMVTQAVKYGPAMFVGQTEIGLTAFLDLLRKRPEKPLKAQLDEVKKLLPDAHVTLHVARTGMEKIEAGAFDWEGVFLEEEHIESFDALGFTAGSTLNSAFKFTPEGVVEKMLLDLKDPNGVVSILAGLPALPAPAKDQPHAMNMLPLPAAAWVSVNVDVASKAPELAAALKRLDNAMSWVPPVRQPAPTQQENPAKAEEPAKPETPPAPPGEGPQTAPRGEETADPKNAAPNTAPRGQEPEKAVDPKPEAKPEPGIEAPKAEAKPDPNAAAQGGEEKGDKVMKKANRARKQPPAVTADRAKAAGRDAFLTWTARLEKYAGTTLEELMKQIDGGVQLGLFVKEVDDEDPPMDLQMGYVLSVMLKDSAPISAALEKAATGETPILKKVELDGGAMYEFLNEDSHGGWYLKGKQLTLSSEGAIAQLAMAAAKHEAGTERFTDRPDVKALVKNALYDPKRPLTFYADGGQFLNMPYNVARGTWGVDDDENMWPTFKELRGHCGPLLLQVEPVKDQPGKVQVTSQTPAGFFVTLWGVLISLAETW